MRPGQPAAHFLYRHEEGTTYMSRELLARLKKLRCRLRGRKELHRSSAGRRSMAIAAAEASAPTALDADKQLDGK
jgi:hypothetical protein